MDTRNPKRLIEPAQPMNPDVEDTREEDDILITCALRFDGYKYVTNRKFDHLAAFRTIEKTGDLAPFEQYQHLALFYMMQRYLYKWGGDMLSRRSPEWRTFRELFFLCCRAKIPKSYQAEQWCKEYVERWERDYRPRLDECIALVRRTHESIDYLPESTAHPGLQGESSIDSDRAYRERLGLARDNVRQFEEQAIEAWQLFPEATIERTRDAIQMNVGGDRGIVLLFTPEALEVRLPTVTWTGPHSPVPSSVLWKRLVLDKLSNQKLHALCQEALSARASQFVPCRFCGREFPPEHRHDDVCHGCAERELGIIH